MTSQLPGLVVPMGRLTSASKGHADSFECIQSRCSQLSFLEKSMQTPLPPLLFCLSERPWCPGLSASFHMRCDATAMRSASS